MARYARAVFGVKVHIRRRHDVRSAMCGVTDLLSTDYVGIQNAYDAEVCKRCRKATMPGGTAGRRS